MSIGRTGFALKRLESGWTMIWRMTSLFLSGSGNEESRGKPAPTGLGSRVYPVMGPLFLLFGEELADGGFVGGADAAFGYEGGDESGRCYVECVVGGWRLWGR